MLARFLEGHGVTDRQAALEHLARVTAGLSGAHLRELVDTAILDEVVDPSKLGTPFSLGDLELF